MLLVTVTLLLILQTIIRMICTKRKLCYAHTFEEMSKSMGFNMKILHVGSKDICMAFVCIGEEYSRDVQDYTNSKLDYCKLHDYTLVSLKEPCAEVRALKNTKKHPSWSKLPFVEYLFSKFSVVCMIDADIYVTNRRISLESFMPKNFDVIIQKGYYVKPEDTIFQSSTVIFKHTARETIRRAFFSSTQDGPRLMFPGMQSQDWGEQTYLQYELEENTDKLSIIFKDLACLQSNACGNKFLFWHLAGSNFKNKLDIKLKQHLGRKS